MKSRCSRLTKLSSGSGRERPLLVPSRISLLRSNLGGLGAKRKSAELRLQNQLMSTRPSSPDGDTKIDGNTLPVSSAQS
jgi:hypothetical protein